MKLSYSVESIKDLQRLRGFIAKQLLQAIDKLKQFPEMGLTVEQAPNPQQIRDLFVENYTIRYLISSEAIFILRLWHNREEK